MNYLIDTHVILWYQHLETKFSKRVLRIFDDSESNFRISTFSYWEIANLIEKNRIVVPMPIQVFLRSKIESLSLVSIPVDLKVIASYQKVSQYINKDPADRIIAATSIAHNLPLITADKNLRDSPILNTIW